MAEEVVDWPQREGRRDLRAIRRSRFGTLETIDDPGQPFWAANRSDRRAGDPAFSHQSLHLLGTAYLVAGKYETASTIFRQRILLSPETDFSRALLAAALGHLGQTDEARRIWLELKAINPKYSFDEHVGRLPFKNQADVDRIREGLTTAALHE